MKIIILCLVVLILGCASSIPPQQHLYLLRSDGKTPEFESDLSIGIGTLEIASYLKRSEIMVQVDSQEMRPARYHRWAEPLDQNIRRYLRDGLSAELQTHVETNVKFSGRWQVQINVSIDELHSTLEGDALLNAVYEIFPLSDPKQLLRKHVQLTMKQTNDGYAALVDAQVRLLDQLAGQIATQIKKMKLTSQ